MAQIMNMGERAQPRIYSGLDCVFRAVQEKIPENGEDSFCFEIVEDSILLGTFDGCGGSGAKKYDAYRQKTGAYIGARAVAGAVQSWFRAQAASKERGNDGSSLKAYILKSLSVCKDNCGNQGKSLLRGSITKEFPTTAAIACCTRLPKEISVECYWAGDSRVYLLDEDGLAQLTVDDLDGLDAFENISGDGVLKNVISASKDFTLRYGRLTREKPFLVFSATDGCFGYIPSPMEFEALLLDTLLEADSMAAFEAHLREELCQIAEDDFSLVGAAFGYGTFDSMKASLAQRRNVLLKTYISRISRTDPDSRKRLWDRYKQDYYRYCMG